MKNKKIVILTIIIAILIFIIIFALYYYKKGKIGNTIINKSEEQIIESILNIKSFNRFYTDNMKGIHSLIMFVL